MQPHKDSRHDLPRPSIADIDPEDPSQLLDEAGQFSVVDIDTELDAQPQAEAEAGLDAAVATDAGEEELDEDLAELDPSQTQPDTYATATDDTGELYGVHLPRPVDRFTDATPDGETMLDAELGETVFETLQKEAALSGANPERDLDVIDETDSEKGHNSSDRRDRPVADKGSGGQGGR